MAAYKRDDWNGLIDDVNDILQNPPADTDCEPIEPLEHVGPNHRWSKADIEAVQDKLRETCDDISFDTIPELWKQSIIDEIRDAIEQAWCDCEEDDDDDEDDCTQEMIDAEHGAEFSILNNAPPRINCEGDNGSTILIRDVINGMQVGAPGIFLRIWRLFRRNTNVNGGGGVSQTQISSGIVSCQGILTYTGSSTMSTTSGVFCGCCPGCDGSPNGSSPSCSDITFCANVVADCQDMLENGFITTSEWVIVIDTGNAFCKLNDDPCP